jgi:glycosyltransferase involved in cell wall biosynthesis
MRVLHVQYDDVANPWVGGGGAVRAHEIYRRLVPEHDVTCITGRFPGAADTVRDGVRYRRLGVERPYALSRWTFARAATRLLAEGEYDAAVVDHSLYTPLRLPDSPKVALNFGQMVGPTARQRWGRIPGALLERIERGRIGQARTISVVSRFLLEQVQPLAKPGVPFFVVSAGVDDALFRIERAESDYVLYYGRFDIFQKGIDRVVQAATPLLRERGALRLVLAGRGRDAAGVRELARASGVRIEVEENIGPERRGELFAGAIAALMPSRFEGFGMVAAEALAAGVPAIVSDRDSLPEVVGDAALLVDPERPDAITNALRRVVDDAELRTRLSAAGRRAARRYSWDTVAGDHAALLASLAGLDGVRDTTDLARTPPEPSKGR